MLHLVSSGWESCSGPSPHFGSHYTPEMPVAAHTASLRYVVQQLNAAGETPMHASQCGPPVVRPRRANPGLWQEPQRRLYFAVDWKLREADEMRHVRAQQYAAQLQSAPARSLDATRQARQ